ncbi:MAG: hypothetical protein COB29_13990 [Sulfitobacter sp.]|nr:MAG: hypothetical protein COB29_13990 [Sulfitobacter sp.]
MATELEKQNWLDTRAGPLLSLYNQFMPELKIFVQEYREIQGYDLDAGLLEGETAFQENEATITILGALAPGSSLKAAFDQLEAINNFVDDGDIAFIASLISTIAIAGEE